MSVVLSNYLKNYHRITITEACEEDFYGDANRIGIWVQQDGTWRLLDQSSKRLKMSKFKPGQSMCNLIITDLFGLSRGQYNKIKASFDNPAWKSWAGIYKANEGPRSGPEFVIVVELPSGAMNSGVGAGVGGATSGLFAGVALTKWFDRDKTKNVSAPGSVIEGESPKLEASTECENKFAELKRMYDDSETSSEENRTALGKALTELSVLKSKCKELISTVDEKEKALAELTARSKASEDRIDWQTDLLIKLVETKLRTEGKLKHDENLEFSDILERNRIAATKNSQEKEEHIRRSDGNIDPDALVVDYLKAYEAARRKDEPSKEQEETMKNFFGRYLKAKVRSSGKQGDLDRFQEELAALKLNSAEERNTAFNQITKDYFESKLLNKRGEDWVDAAKQ